MANKRKITTAVIASVAAAALLLGGTFAWNSISQQAKNESAGIVNVGGRLHDDFNGTNKDVYVENFTDPLKGGQPIYARIRLDEYMEVGPEAGLTDENGFVDGRNAASVVTTADINDPSTWTPHKPSTDCALCTGGETCLIHDHWTWDMDGQKTFMPTFNKDKDSLDADINGTYAGTDATDNIHYDDYVTYITTGGADVDVIAGTVNSNAVTIPAGTTANALTQANTDVTTVTNVALYDDDSDNVPGNNPPRQEQETHTAKETADGTVITMSEWINTYDKAPGNYWVYDTDGWAYWANPIMPGEATGLLLDSIEMTKNPGEKCYYAINVVGQFATAGDWDPFTTDGGSAPSANAMELLTNAVAAVPVVTVTADGNVTTAAPGDVVQFNAGVTIGTTAALANGDFDWSVIDENGDAAASGIDADGKLTVNAGDVGKTLTVVARSKTHNGAVGISAIAVASGIATTDDLAATAYVLLTENGTMTDGSTPAYTLSFVRSYNKVNTGDKYNGDAIVEVFVDVENKTHVGTSSIPWADRVANITNVSIDNIIQPVSTAFWFNGMTSLTAINNIENLKTENVTTMQEMFRNCKSLTELDLSGFNVDNVTTMYYMFAGCNSLETITGMDNWNVGNVTDMYAMFFQCSKLTTLNLTTWDVGQVTTMRSMFRDCRALTDVGNIVDWNVENVTDINQLFARTSLKTIDLSNWNVSNVTDMGNMFNGCTSLTSIDGISAWDTSKVTDMSNMFNGCTSLTSLVLTDWNVSNVTNMINMFYDCRVLTSIGNVSGWNVEKVTSMNSMFRNCYVLSNIGDLKDWKTDNVKSFHSMFRECRLLTTAEIGNLKDWGLGSTDSISAMFAGCTSLVELDLSSWDTKNIVYFYNVFDNCTNLKEIKGINNWTTSNADNMANMFSNCTNLLSVNIGGWDTSSVTNMANMFSGCSNLENIGKLDNWNVSKVTTMKNMFNACGKLTDIGKLSNWNTGEVKDMYAMFFMCSSLTDIGDLSNWDVSNVTDMYCMFDSCTGLTTLGDISKWNVENVTNMSYMFRACSGFTLNLSGWNVTNVTAYTDFNTGATGVTAPTWVN